MNYTLLSFLLCSRNQFSLASLVAKYRVLRSRENPEVWRNLLILENIFGNLKFSQKNEHNKW